MKRLRWLVAAVAVLSLGAMTPGVAAPRTEVPHVLVYSQTLGFRHISITHAKQVLADLAKGGRFTVEFSEDPAVLTAQNLRGVDVVLWLHNTAASGRTSPFSDAQEQAYGRWMLCGGGHVGVHASIDSYNQEAFPEYFAVQGAIFDGHPITVTSALDDQDPDNEGWGEPEAEIKVHDARSPMTRPWRGEDTFRFQDEFYKLDRDPAETVRDYRLLLSLQQFTDPQGIVVSSVYPGDYGDDAPLSWSGSFRGRNRAFYTNLGHSVATWDDDSFRQHLANGIRWAGKPRLDRECFAASKAKTR